MAVLHGCHYVHTCFHFFDELFRAIPVMIAKVILDVVGENRRWRWTTFVMNSNPYEHYD